MTRFILTANLLALLISLYGCTESNSGRGQIIADRTRQATDRHAVIEAAKDKEVDIIEDMSLHRRAYRQSLEALIKYYRDTGNYMKREWAQKELGELDAIPQYNYIIEAAVAGPELKATAEIPEADDLYYQGMIMEDDARKLILIKSSEKLRLALDKYNQIIRLYPTSDKIDDAAYRAGKIYEEFKDYSIALIYYQRTYQWDPDTVYPARYKAARILDDKLHRRAEALELYSESLKYDSLNASEREYINERIAELSVGGGTSD
jgi:tetratricopeptide (TPR) repeat protein